MRPYTDHAFSEVTGPGHHPAPGEAFLRECGMQKARDHGWRWGGGWGGDLKPLHACGISSARLSCRSRIDILLYLVSGKTVH